VQPATNRRRLSAGGYGGKTARRWLQESPGLPANASSGEHASPLARLLRQQVVATPVDPSLAAGAQQVLNGLAQQKAVAGSKPVGSALTGNFQQGQVLETQVQLQPNKCYTVVAAGLPPVAEVNVKFLRSLRFQAPRWCSRRSRHGQPGDPRREAELLQDPTRFRSP
jgi:hypothetical protein